MAPYKEFDHMKNPIVVVMDRCGVCLVNLRTQEVFIMQSFEDMCLELLGKTRVKKPVLKDKVDNFKMMTINEQ